MNSFLSNMGQKIYNFCHWAVHSHPGKFYGTIAGLILALLIIVIGIWQTLLLIFLSSIGFYLGKLWDDGLGIPVWLDRILKRIKKL